MNENAFMYKSLYKVKIYMLVSGYYIEDLCIYFIEKFLEIVNKFKVENF